MAYCYLINYKYSYLTVNNNYLYKKKDTSASAFVRMS